MLLPVADDWRISLLTWLQGVLPLPLAAEPVQPERWSTSLALRLVCAACSQRYITTAPVALENACPGCGGNLRRLDTWNLASEPLPPWEVLG